MSRAIRRFGLERVPISIEVLEPVCRVPSIDDDYSYSMEVSSPRVQLGARTEWGAIAGLSTLAQLSGSQGIPHCHVSDRPTYAWRGLMLDLARRFISIKTLEETLDLMAYFRLNVLHLHLSDDQGFRFGSERFPEIASREHYSVSEMRSLVAYAADRAIRVVPELDMPGHCSSWLAARPDWGALREQVDTRSFGPQKACLDVSDPAVRKAVAEILSEVAEIFPDRYLHIGGDEVSPDWWERSESIQRYMKRRRMATNGDLQAEFNLYLYDTLKKLRKTPLGWDEVLHRDLPGDFVAQVWRGLDLRDAALESGHDVIVSSPYYLDLGYPADIHYRYSPQSTVEDSRAARELEVEDPRLAHVSAGLAWAVGPYSVPALRVREPKGRLLGGEACLWAELVPERFLHQKAWSRMPAIAERFWNGSGAVPEPEMRRNMAYHQERLKLQYGFPLDRPDLSWVPEEAWPLIELLEPVKWYARLLGTDRLQARIDGDAEPAAARPYDADSPLDQLVDWLAPDSISSRQCVQDIEDGSDLSAWIEGWRAQAKCFHAVAEREPLLCCLEEASDALAILADVAEGKQDPDPRLAGPFGEFVLPVALAFCPHDD